MGYRGSTHEYGLLHIHEKHMDIGSAGLSLSGEDSLVARCVEIYSVRSGYTAPIGILAQATRGVWDIVVF